MAEPKKGKATVIYCTCPTCETRLVVNDEGDILQSFYEPDEKEAQKQASKHIPGEEKETDGATGSGKKTIPDGKKEELEDEDPEEEEEPKKSDSKNTEFGLDGW